MRDRAGGVFSCPCFLITASGDCPVLCMMLLSTLAAAEKKASSVGWTLFVAGANGLPLVLGRSLIGLSRALALSFRAFSKAVGSSWAPGGIVLLLGLPCGVETGSMKAFLVVLGVSGRSSAADLASLAPCDEGNILEMKLAIAGVIDQTASSRGRMLRLANPELETTQLESWCGKQTGPGGQNKPWRSDTVASGATTSSRSRGYIYIYMYFNDSREERGRGRASDDVETAISSLGEYFVRHKQKDEVVGEKTDEV